MRPLNLKLLVATTTVFAALLYLVCVSSQPFFPDWLLSEQEALGLREELRAR